MKKFILPLAAVIVLMSASCTKENLSRVDDIFNNGTDDHGGSSGSGGGENIPASSVPGAVMDAFNAKYPGACETNGKNWIMEIIRPNLLLMVSNGNLHFQHQVIF